MLSRKHKIGYVGFSFLNEIPIFVQDKRNGSYMGLGVPNSPPGGPLPISDNNVSTTNDSPAGGVENDWEVTDIPTVSLNHSVSSKKA